MDAAAHNQWVARRNIEKKEVVEECHLHILSSQMCRPKQSVFKNINELNDL